MLGNKQRSFCCCCWVDEVSIDLNLLLMLFLDKIMYLVSLGWFPMFGCLSKSFQFGEKIAQGIPRQPYQYQMVLRLLS